MAANRWKQDKFYISTFNATTCDEHMATQLRYHKETGFNLIEFTFKEPEHIKKALPICEELGLHTLIQDRKWGGIGLNNPTLSTDEIVQEAVATYGKFPHLLGYYIWDEPGFDTFFAAKETTDRFRKYDPGRLGFSVMVPSYGVYPWKARGSDWDDSIPLEETPFARYVRQFVEECDCDVISIDYYPFAVNKECTLVINDMWRDVGVVRHYARQAGRPFWFYFQGKWDFPSDDNVGGIGMTYEKLAAQTYGTLAYGVKQLSYFTSSSLVSTMTEEKGPLYDVVKLLNHRLMNVGTFLLNKACVAVTHSALEERWIAPYYLDTMEKFPEILSLPDDLILGRFEDKTDPRLCFMLSNKAFEHPVDGAVRLDRAYRVACFNDDTGLCEDLGVLDTIPLHLDAGVGKVFLLEEVTGNV